MSGKHRGPTFYMPGRRIEEQSAIELLEGPALKEAIERACLQSWAHEYGMSEAEWMEIVANFERPPAERSNVIAGAIDRGNGGRRKPLVINSITDFEPARSPDQHAQMLGFKRMNDILELTGSSFRRNGIVQNGQNLWLGIYGAGTGTIDAIEELSAAKQFKWKMVGFADRIHIDPGESTENMIADRYRDDEELVTALKDLVEWLVYQLNLTRPDKKQTQLIALRKSLNTIKQFFTINAAGILPSPDAGEVFSSERRIGDTTRKVNSRFVQIVDLLRTGGSREISEQFRKWFGSDFYTQGRDLDNEAVASPGKIICANFQDLESADPEDERAKILASLHLLIDVRSLSHCSDETWVNTLQRYGATIPLILSDGTRPTGWGAEDEFCRLDRIMERRRDFRESEIGVMYNGGTGRVRALSTQARNRNERRRPLLSPADFEPIMDGGLHVTDLKQAAQLYQYSSEQVPQTMLFRDLMTRGLSSRQRITLNHRLANSLETKAAWHHARDVYNLGITGGLEPELAASRAIDIFLEREEIREFIAPETLSPKVTD